MSGLRPRLVAAPVLVIIALVVQWLTGPPADAAPFATASPSDVAERLVAAVPVGAPLRVVETRVRADGSPTFTTTVVATRSQAVAAVRNLLASGRSVSMAQPVRATATTVDPLRSRQWGLTALRAERAWTVTRGGASRSTRAATVAVVDTGVDLTHPDLRDRLVTGTDVVAPGTSADDQNGHGTHVAGIVAATAGNARGGAGLAPLARVMPVRVLDADGSGSSDDVARGVVWAAQHGAQVVNLSLGSNADDAALGRAVAFARSRGLVVVAAAGNDGESLLCGLLGCLTPYPAAYPGVVGVASVDRDGARSSFSSPGSWVDVAAPGGDIVSTMAPDNTIGGPCAGQLYCALSGTSMATPFVAAAAALASSRRQSGTTIERRLTATADDRGRAGRDDDFGSGLVDPVELIGAR